MINKKSIFRWSLFFAVFIVGYLAGNIISPPFYMWWGNKKKQTTVKIEDVLSQNLVNMHSKKVITKDTLCAHERNLFVFWSPTCKYCRQFFQNKLNNTTVGVFCLPITDDSDYVKFFVEKNEIPYLQLYVADTNGIAPIDIPSLDVIPTFVLLDSKGTVIEQKRGINDIDSFIDKIYK